MSKEQLLALLLAIAAANKHPAPADWAAEAEAALPADFFPAA